MKLTMLGTGNAAVTECYNTCFVLSEGEKHLLVDGGGGNLLLQRFKAAGLKWQDMRHIIVTHCHIDHLLGIVWMLRFILQNMNRGKYQGEAWIYGHNEVVETLDTLAHLLLTEAGEEIAREGREAQYRFFEMIHQGIDEEELLVWERLTKKIQKNIENLNENI